MGRLLLLSGRGAEYQPMYVAYTLSQLEAMSRWAVVV
jgi:hypothetical protein